MKYDGWTIDNIDDLTGKVIIVTGGNSGLGFESTRIFAMKGATTILAARNEQRGTDAVNKIKKEFPNATIELMLLDLGDAESVKSFATTFTTKYKQLDILLNNAGIMTTPYNSTKQGFESQIGVNHLGHFLLTSLLFETVKNTKGSRIVNTASIAHKAGKINLDSFKFVEGGKYRKMKAYSQSKLSNLLFTYELAKKVQEQKLDVLILASHPGVSNTNLGRHLKGGFVGWMSKVVSSTIAHSQYHGALPGVRAATDTLAETGTYYGPDGLFGFKGKPVVAKSTKRSHDKELANKLWVASEKFVNQPFSI